MGQSMVLAEVSDCRRFAEALWNVLGACFPLAAGCIVLCFGVRLASVQLDIAAGVLLAAGLAALVWSLCAVSGPERLVRSGKWLIFERGKKKRTAYLLAELTGVWAERTGVDDGRAVGTLICNFRDGEDERAQDRVCVVRFVRVAGRAAEFLRKIVGLAAPKQDGEPLVVRSEELIRFLRHLGRTLLLALLPYLGLLGGLWLSLPVHPFGTAVLVGVILPGALVLLAGAAFSLAAGFLNRQPETLVYLTEGSFGVWQRGRYVFYDPRDLTAAVACPGVMGRGAGALRLDFARDGAAEKVLVRHVETVSAAAERLLSLGPVTPVRPA